MKYKVLKMLKESNEEYVSGEAISGLLNVSRTAIWKYVNELKEEGYAIESSSKKGYKLVNSVDILNEYEIGCNLKTDIFGRKIYCFPVIDSTNNYAKKLAYENCAEGIVVVAEKQTSGRGRLGRTWDSMSGKGIWMSIVLRPSIGPEDVQIITLAASVAVVRAIASATGIRTGIKWPNDIVLDGKKVCGILTEMNSEMERVNFIVLGIGINVNHQIDDFGKELSNSAVSLRAYAQGQFSSFGKNEEVPAFNRSEIIQNVLYELEIIYNKIKNNLTAEIIEEWKKYSVTLGKRVKITSRREEYEGVARDVTNDGKLVVEGIDGAIHEVVSGEVSVRGIMGYA